MVGPERHPAQDAHLQPVQQNENTKGTNISIFDLSGRVTCGNGGFGLGIRVGTCVEWLQRLNLRPQCREDARIQSAADDQEKPIERALASKDEREMNEP